MQRVAEKVLKLQAGSQVEDSSHGSVLQEQKARKVLPREAGCGHIQICPGDRLHRRPCSPSTTAGDLQTCHWHKCPGRPGTWNTLISQ